ncbi:MAG: hypothetical protein INH04_04685 [Gemmatimonas sp.]|nr:hypothetical protein [Gemmatimonas sp.]
MTRRLFTGDNGCKLRLSRHQSTSIRAPMNTHKLARLTPFGREVVVQRVAAGVRVAVMAREAGVSRQTVYK